MTANTSYGDVARRYFEGPVRFAYHGVWAVSACVAMMAAAHAQTATTQSNASAAETKLPAANAAAGQGDDDEIEMLESARDYTFKGSYWLAREVNSWFGDAPFEGNGRVSGYVRVNGLWDQRDGSKANVRFRLRVKLPNLQNRAYAFVGQDNKDEIVRDQPAAFSREQMLLRENGRQDQSFFAGLGYDLKDNIDFRVGFRGGLNPYVQARYRKDWQLSPRDIVYFRESLFWSVKDSVGSTTVVDYEHALTSSLIARWSTVGTITRRTHGFEWQTGVGLIKDFPGIRTASIETLVQGNTGEVDVSNYGVRASWRQPVYKEWLFGKVTLGHFWPKDKEIRSRERAWALGASVEMHF